MSKKAALAKKSTAPTAVPAASPAKAAVVAKKKQPVKAVDAQGDVAMEDVRATTPKTKNANKRSAASADDESPAKKTRTGAATLTNAVVVTNLPVPTAEATLTEAFSKHGEVTSVRLIKNKETRAQSEAIVTFATAAASKAAVAAGSITVDGKKATVRAPKPREEGEPWNVLVVRNLAYTVTVESLTELFSKYGEVTNSNIAKRKRGEKDTSKGYGGVTFASVKEATAAREALDGAEFEGRNIYVHYAKAREE